MSSSQAPHLLKIAAELRNKIYRLVLTTNEIEVDPATFNIRKALVDSTSQLRAETRGIFYAENKFVITLDGSNVGPSVKWLESLGKNAPLVASVRLKIQPSEAWVDKILNKISCSRELADLQIPWLDMIFAQRGGRDGGLVRKALQAAGSMSLPHKGVRWSYGIANPDEEFGACLRNLYSSHWNWDVLKR